MSHVIDEFVQKINQDWQVEICKRLDQVAHEAVPEVEEKIQYSKPHYKKNGKYAAVIGTAKDWVTFTIFNATDIEAPGEAPDNFFEPGPPERKTVKIRKGQTVDYDLLTKLLQQAAATI
jgi:hypothetical protein